MEYLQILQESLESSVKELLDTSAKVISYCETIAYLKEKFVKSKIIGKEFLAKDLYKSDRQWELKRLGKNSNMKVIGIKANVVDDNLVNTIRYNDDDEKIIKLKIYFLRNPKEILESSKEYTESEKRVLSKIQGYYNNYQWRKNYEETIIDLNHELYQLKHEYYIAERFDWSWNIGDILEPCFIKKSLRCGNTVLINEYI